MSSRLFIVTPPTSIRNTSPLWSHTKLKLRTVPLLGMRSHSSVRHPTLFGFVERLQLFRPVIAKQVLAHPDPPCVLDVGQEFVGGAKGVDQIPVDGHHLRRIDRLQHVTLEKDVEAHKLPNPVFPNSARVEAAEDEEIHLHAFKTRTIEDRRRALDCRPVAHDLRKCWKHPVLAVAGLAHPLARRLDIGVTAMPVIPAGAHVGVTMKAGAHDIEPLLIPCKTLPAHEVK